jgi:AraC-like DNA-binding protein
MKISRKLSDYAGRSELIFENAATCPLGKLSAAGMGSQGDLNHWRKPDELRSRHSFYGLAMILPGTHGNYNDENNFSCEITYGDFIIQFPHLKHRYAPGEGQMWNEMCLGFKGTLFDTLRESGVLNDTCPVWHMEDIAPWQTRFEQFLRTPRPTTLHGVTREVAQFLSFLLELIENATPKNQTAAPEDWFTKACVMLTNDLSRKPDLREIAAALGMNYDSFRRHFHQRASQPPFQFRDDHRRQIACQRLQETNDSCWIIARYLGFYDETHFSHCFKKWTGSTPRQFRENCRKDAGKGLLTKSKRK